MIYLFNRQFKVFTMEQLIQCRIRDMKFKNKVLYSERDKITAA